MGLRSQNKVHRRSTRVTLPRHDSSSKCWRHGPSQCAFERHFPPGHPPFWILSGGECLSNAHWLGPWRQHLMTNYGLRQNHRKIIRKTKKSAFCVPYSVLRWRTRHSKRLSLLSSWARFPHGQSQSTLCRKSWVSSGHSGFLPPCQVVIL
jgi:hypothetical protein